jgi:hypothetical protein
LVGPYAPRHLSRITVQLIECASQVLTGKIAWEIAELALTINCN